MKLPILLTFSLLLVAGLADFALEEPREMNKLLRTFKQLPGISRDYQEIAENLLEKLSDEDPDGDSKARFLISGFLDSSMQGDWNKTFVNLVNHTNFDYKAVLSAFDLLSTESFENTTDFSRIQNASVLLTNSLKTLIKSAFPLETPVNTRYDSIYQSLKRSLGNYEFSRFVNETACLVQEKYEVHASFLEMKWWAKKDLHKAGLIWGNFDVAAKNCGLSLWKSSADYSDAQKFFFGFVTAKLQTNWSVELISSVSEENFDFLTILQSLDVIAQNANKSQPETASWTSALKNISDVLEKVAQSLFPHGKVANDCENVDELLNFTQKMHADPEIFWEIVQKSRETVDVAGFIQGKILESAGRDNSSAGFLWEKLLQILEKNANSSELPRLRDINMGAKLFLSGFLDSTLQGDWNKTFVNLVNYSNFPYDLVINSFSSLQTVNFSNFSLSDQYKLWNASSTISHALNLLVNATFPFENRTKRWISSNFSRIFEQLSLSLDNYNGYFSFANRTHAIASKIDLNSVLQQFSWLSSKDLHRTGLLWGALDANLSAETAHFPLKSDEMAQKFFFGFSSAKLGKSWQRDFALKIRRDFFDHEEIAGNLSVIAQNIDNRSISQWKTAVNSLYFIADSAINALFPSEIPQNLTNIYELLDETRGLYSDVENFSNYVENAGKSVNLSQFLTGKLAVSMGRDNSSAGFLWEKFNEIVLSGKSQANNATEDRYARELLKGLLEFAGNRSVPQSFLGKINASLFNYKEIVESFAKLAINSYNFSRNHTDEERFVEGVAVFSENLRKVLLLANSSRESREIAKIVRKCFEIFHNHASLLRKIRKLFENRVDIRYFFGKAYEKARYTSKFIEAGAIWARAIEIIEKGTNRSEEIIDENSASFLAGLLRNFGNLSERREILEKIAKKFNVSAVLRDLEEIGKEVHEVSKQKLAFFEISKELYAIIDEMFPLVGYGYRYGLELRAIAEENREIFEFLSGTAKFYANFEEIQRVLSRGKCKEIVRETLRNIAAERDFFAKGWKWAKLNEFLVEEAQKAENRAFLGVY